MFRACSSRSRKPSADPQACRSGRWWSFFPLYGCGKNTTAWLIARKGRVWPVTIFQAMGGSPACFCSDPIPPVAVATDQPARRDLSRSAGSKRTSRCFHAPFRKKGIPDPKMRNLSSDFAENLLTKHRQGANNKRLAPERWIVPDLDRGIECVHIHVDDDLVHPLHLLSC